MAYFKNTGASYHEEDRPFGPFMVRIGGTSNFVSAVDPKWNGSYPPGKVELVEGWDNAKALKFDSIDEALAIAVQVWNIEGYHTSVEPAGRI